VRTGVESAEGRDLDRTRVDSAAEERLGEWAARAVPGAYEHDLESLLPASSHTADDSASARLAGAIASGRRQKLSTVVCFVVGARPNFMKVAPVFRALEKEASIERVLLHTGQHYDEAMSEIFIGQLGLPPPDVFLGVGSGSHAEQTARVLTGVERVLIERRPALVVVAGDVNSTLAAALAAVKLDIPVAHIESGLRSFDPRMPEEHNRKLTDHLSLLLFAHSASAIENLRAEGIADEHVHLVGNTMVDSVFACLPRALSTRPWENLGVEAGSYALVTLHRPALVDHLELLEQTVRSLNELAEAVPVVFPVHPRTRGRIADLGLGQDALVPSLLLTEPLGYLDFLALEARALLVLTDSGGVQEETSVLGTPCFTLRDSTERPVTITEGTNTLLGLRPETIGGLAEGLARPTEAPQIALWDGQAGPRAAKVLAAFLAR
jgi:UDP-N-acetylglucosamine 2-epimerase (non-hydrolysing)